MTQTILLTLVVCGSLISVVKRGILEDKIECLPATFIMAPSLEGKSILVRDSFDWTLSSLGSDDFPRTACKDYHIALVLDVLTKSTHPP